MTAPARSLPVAPRQPRSKILVGAGMVLAAGVKAAKVTYELQMDDALGPADGWGVLRAKHATLERMWLQPRAILRLANGRRFDIAITELKSVTALFEVVGEV